MEILNIFISILALITLEIVLGIDNLVFLAVLTAKLPKEQRKKARQWGLTFAWMTRLILLGFAFWLIKLTVPLVQFNDFSFSVRDLFLFVGGCFLIYKATQEIYQDVDEPNTQPISVQYKLVSFRQVVLQVAIMDIIFSLDSVLTAIGLTPYIWVMAIAITCAILVMLYASEWVSRFIERHPSLKMLALSFLILIGTVLIADSFSFHIPRGYIYFAMSFSLVVEMLNIYLRLRKSKKFK